VFAGVKVVLILGDAPLLAFVWATLAEAALVALLLLAMLSVRGLALRKLKVSLSRAKVLLEDSWPLILAGIAVTIYMRIDLIMLGQMLGDETVGIYSAATRMSEVWYFVPTVVVASVLPTLVQAKKISATIYQARLQRLCNSLTWMAIALAVPMTFIAEWLVVLLYGPDYEAAADILSIHIWAAVFVFLGIGSGVFFTIENFARKFLHRTAIGCALNILLNIILIPLYGMKGAAIATFFSQFFVNYLIDVFDNATRQLFFMKTKAFFPSKIFGK
jgi:PST family polysaccharide transporter